MTNNHNNMIYGFVTSDLLIKFVALAGLLLRHRLIVFLKKKIENKRFSFVYMRIYGM